MLFEVEYSTFGVYCNQSNSPVAEKSRIAKGKIKNANPNTIQAAINYIKGDYKDIYKDFFGKDVTVVPCPSSSIIKEDFLNPPLTICKLLVANGLAYEVCDILYRKTPIRRSSHCNGAEERPSIQEHIQSIDLKNNILSTKKITIIDDVLTLGRTTYACAKLLNDRFPNIEIRIFAVMRTRNKDKYDDVKNPNIGIMTYNPNTGKVKLQD